MCRRRAHGTDASRPARAGVMLRAPLGRTVSEDRSLEEFAGADADADVDADATNTDATADAADEDGSPEGDHLDAVDPAEPTYDRSPDGAPCAACGERVTRRWRDDGDYVCDDCKEW